MISGKPFWLRRAVDSEREVLDLLVQRRRNKTAAVKLMRKLRAQIGGGSTCDKFLVAMSRQQRLASKLVKVKPGILAVSALMTAMSQRRRLRLVTAMCALPALPFMSARSNASTPPRAYKRGKRNSDLSGDPSGAGWPRPAPPREPSRDTHPRKLARPSIPIQFGTRQRKPRLPRSQTSARRDSESAGDALDFQCCR